MATLGLWRDMSRAAGPTIEPPFTVLESVLTAQQPDAADEVRDGKTARPSPLIRGCWADLSRCDD